MYTHQNAIIVIPKSLATYRYHRELRQDGFEWYGDRWERRYDNTLYFKWANILRHEPGSTNWPVRRLQQLSLL